jgi:hypothetical protein
MSPQLIEHRYTQIGYLVEFEHAYEIPHRAVPWLPGDVVRPAWDDYDRELNDCAVQPIGIVVNFNRTTKDMLILWSFAP